MPACHTRLPEVLSLRNRDAVVKNGLDPKQMFRPIFALLDIDDVVGVWLKLNHLTQA